MRNDFIGVVPAAGRAVRLSPLRYPKELLPILYELDGEERRAQPMTAIEYTLRAMRQADVQRVMLVVSPAKADYFRLLGSGGDYGLNLGYLIQENASGLARAVDSAYPWVGERYVCLALPDTIYQPLQGPALLCREIVSRRADVMLGVFPTDRPEQLGPVTMDSQGRVLQVQEKPARTDVRNTWGMAVWSPTFGHFLHEHLSAVPEAQDVHLGELFDKAIHAGLKVEAHFFAEGSYRDAGTPEGLASLLLRPPPRETHDG